MQFYFYGLQSRLILTVRIYLKILICGYVYWPFVLQFSSSPFDFVSLFVGALHIEVGYWWPWGRFNFCSALLVKVDFVDLEANLIFLFAVLFLWGSILLTLRQIYFLQCSSYEGRFCWPWGKFNFYSALLVKVDFVDLEANFYSALPVKVDWVDLEARIYFLQWITLDIQTPGFLKLLLQIVHWHVFVCAPDSHFPSWNGFQHQNGLCETKHSPAWAMANMFPMWPQDSCFSLVVAGVGGLPFRWHDASLPQWSLQTGKMDL